MSRFIEPSSLYLFTHYVSRILREAPIWPVRQTQVVG
jgi:hypothetical protein